MKNSDGSGLKTVKFSIRTKLIIIISIIVLVSLGSITVLVSWLVREDLRIAAEDNNFEMNRRSAMMTENIITSIYTNSQILMQIVTSLGTSDDLSEKTVDLFFGQNPQIALLLIAAGGNIDDTLVNRHFFLSREIDLNLVDSFPENHRADLARAAWGETVLVNVSPWFNIPLIALFFPWNEGAGMVLFSPVSLSDTFSFGTNQSYLINDSGDILVHADIELVMSVSNIAEEHLNTIIWENPQRNAQILFTNEDDVRFFLAFTKLNIGGAVVITNIEYEKVFEGIAATTRRNIYLTITVLSISILFIWFFSKSISIPIAALAAAARTIEGGDFSIKLNPKGNDEISMLTSSFQRMSTALSFFGRFTNRDIALRSMRGEIKPGGQQKNATILFSDIRGFTEKSEHFTSAFGEDASERIVQWLNDYFTRMVECVEKTGGVVDKFVGDGVMAHWGTDHSAGSPKKDAFNCIFAALMMRKVLYEMNKSRNPDDMDNPPIRIGCGINSGTVTAGQIGSELRMEYTVIGEPVNLAYRIESFNKPLATDILISEDTWKLVKDSFVTEEMAPVMVKGREKPLRIFAVINFSGIDKGPRSIASVRRLLGITPQVFKRRITDGRGE